MTEARRLMGASALVGQKPIEHIAKFNEYVAKAWDHLVEAHKAFADTASDELRLSPSMWGAQDCDPNGIDQGAAVVGLRSVS